MTNANERKAKPEAVRPGTNVHLLEILTFTLVNPSVWYLQLFTVD